jgi:hypothetical protein
VDAALDAALLDAAAGGTGFVMARIDPAMIYASTAPAESAGGGAVAWRVNVPAFGTAYFDTKSEALEQCRLPGCEGAFPEPLFAASPSPDTGEGAIRAEREACAKVCEDYPAHQHGHLDANPHYAAQQAAHEIAAAIRARGLA